MYLSRPGPTFCYFPWYFPIVLAFPNLCSGMPYVWIPNISMNYMYIYMYIQTVAFANVCKRSGSKIQDSRKTSWIQGPDFFSTSHVFFSTLYVSLATCNVSFPSPCFHSHCAFWVFVALCPPYLVFGPPTLDSLWRHRHFWNGPKGPIISEPGQIWMSFIVSNVFFNEHSLVSGWGCRRIHAWICSFAASAKNMHIFFWSRNVCWRCATFRGYLTRKHKPQRVIGYNLKLRYLRRPSRT